MIYRFSNKETEKICELFENEIILSEIGKIFRCSKDPIKRILIETLGIETYKEIAKEHSRINRQTLAQKVGLKYGPINGPKNWKKWNADHPEQLKENGRKNGPINGPEHLKKWKKEYPEEYNKIVQENGRKLVEWCANNHNFISRPEALFYLTCLSKNFWLKDIFPQYYIKKIKHFAVPSQKLLFEVDGDYYHGHSGDIEKDKKAIARDAQIDKWAKDNGWTIFRYNNEKMKKLGILK